MRGAMLVATLIGCAAAPVAGIAAVPKCALDLAQPDAGGVLTGQQIAANQACLRALADEAAATKLRGQIFEDEHKMHEKADVQSGSATTASATGSSPLIAPMSPDQPVPAIPDTVPHPALPTTSMILKDGKRVSATLRLPDGRFLDVAPGTTLPGGAVVAGITASEVFVRQDGQVQRLADDDGNAPVPALPAAAVQASGRIPGLRLMPQQPNRAGFDTLGTSP